MVGEKQLFICLFCVLFSRAICTFLQYSGLNLVQSPEEEVVILRNRGRMSGDIWKNVVKKKRSEKLPNNKSRVKILTQ